MPGEFALESLVGVRVALDATVGQRRFPRHNEGRLITPNSRHVMRRVRKVGLLCRVNSGGGDERRATLKAALGGGHIHGSATGAIY